jgi:hypothetical protein
MFPPLAFRHWSENPPTATLLVSKSSYQIPSYRQRYRFKDLFFKRCAASMAIAVP